MAAGEQVVYVLERLLLKKLLDYVSEFEIDKLNLTVTPGVGLTVRAMNTSHVAWVYGKLAEEGMMAVSWQMPTPREFVVGMSVPSWRRCVDSGSSRTETYLRLYLAPDRDKVTMQTMRMVGQPPLNGPTPVEDPTIWQVKTTYQIKLLDLDVPCPDMKFEDPDMMVLIHSKTFALEIDKHCKDTASDVTFWFQGDAAANAADQALRQKLQKTQHGGRAAALWRATKLHIVKTMDTEAADTEIKLVRQDLRRPADDSPAGTPAAHLLEPRTPNHRRPADEGEPEVEHIDETVVVIGDVLDPAARCGALGVAATKSTAVPDTATVLVQADTGVVLREKGSVMRDRKMRFGPRLLWQGIHKGVDLSATVSLSFSSSQDDETQLLVMGFDMQKQGNVIAAICSLVNIDM
jgi:hypothetical protein